MIKQNQTYLNRLHVVMDAVCIYFAGFAAWYIRFKCTIFGFWLNQEIFDKVFATKTGEKSIPAIIQSFINIRNR